MAISPYNLTDNPYIPSWDDEPDDTEESRQRVLKILMNYVATVLLFGTEKEVLTLIRTARFLVTPNTEKRRVIMDRMNELKYKKQLRRRGLPLRPEEGYIDRMLPVSLNNMNPSDFYIPNIRKAVTEWKNNKENATEKYGPIEEWKWDVSARENKNMSNLFAGMSKFNEDISDWDVSNVEYMDNMFKNCKNFNQPIIDWDVGNVKRMKNMFNNCESFSQNLSRWNIDNVVDCPKGTNSIFTGKCRLENRYKPKF